MRPPTGEERRLIEALLVEAASARRALPELSAPCFAHMRVRTNARVRHVLLGPQTSVGSEVTIIDWLRAPLAEVFFSSRDGDDYEVEVDERTLEGILLERHLLGFERGELAEIQTRAAVLRRRGDGEWEAVEGADSPGISLRDESARNEPATPLFADLDAEQRRAVELPEKRSLLVLGEAGFGKTVVALHRMVFLRERAVERNRKFRALVLVPTEGLRRLTLSMLDRLGLENVEVQTFDAWVSREARRIFRDLPTRDSRDTSAAVIRFKRHPALRAVLRELADQGPRPKKSSRKKTTRRRDLLHLFGDRALLERAVGQSGGTLTERMVTQVLAHTHVQFSKTTEEAYAHVDADRLETVDGRSIDDGTPMQDANSMDLEDCAVLFELNYLRAGIDATSAGRLTRYDHIVLDEAQEFAAIELAVIGRAVQRGGTLTVAGDEHQQLDDTACFGGWAGAMAELDSTGKRKVETITLATSYRCPPAVEAFARGLFSDTRREEVPSAAESGRDSAILFSTFASECHLAARLVDSFLAIRERDLRATIAVICRAEPSAERLHTAIRRGVEARLALSGDFLFEPGVSVTHVGEVKGLEFDYVVVPDLSPLAYPDSPEARRALYVAVTRARHRLWLATTSRWSVLAGQEDRSAAPAPVRADASPTGSNPAS